MENEIFLASREVEAVFLINDKFKNSNSSESARTQEYVVCLRWKEKPTEAVFFFSLLKVEQKKRK